MALALATRDGQIKKELHTCRNFRLQFEVERLVAANSRLFWVLRLMRKPFALAPEPIEYSTRPTPFFQTTFVK